MLNLLRTKMSLLSRNIEFIHERSITIKDYLMQQYPLPIGDLMRDPLTTEPWWKYQTMYFHHLLRLHPPQLSCPRNVGSQNSRRTHSSAYFNCQRHSPRHEERNETPRLNENPQRNPQHSASPPVVNLAGPPNLFVYNLHANNGQHPTDFCMGSSIQHTAVDFVPDEGAYNIRVWYSRPLE